MRGTSRSRAVSPCEPRGCSRSLACVGPRAGRTAFEEEDLLAILTAERCGSGAPRLNMSTGGLSLRLDRQFTGASI